MFTGIVQDVGRIVSLERREGDVRLRIAVTHLQLDHTSPGDSIAVSGVCLTALDLDKTPGAQSFAADVSNETLSLTTLGSLSVGSRVNLEPALRAGDALGGLRVLLLQLFLQFSLHAAFAFFRLMSARRRLSALP